MQHTDPELFDGEIREATAEELNALESDASLLDDDDDAPYPPYSNTGGKLGQLVEPTCKSQICGADGASTCRVSETEKPKRKSRAKNTGRAVQAWLDSAKFDWFQGVIPAEDGTGTCLVGGVEEKQALVDAYRFLRVAGLHAYKSTSGGKGYAVGRSFVVGRTGKDVVATVASGSYTGGMPNLTITGGMGLCAEIAPLVQRRWQNFRLTRADVCIDIHGKKAMGLWDVLHDMSLSFAKSRGMAAPEVMGLSSPETGRTFYLGDRQDGDVYLRVYEKGKQMRGVKGVLDAPEDWLRIEFVMRNIDGDLKAKFGQLSPGDMIRAKIWPRKWLALAVMKAGDSERLQAVSPVRLRCGAEPGDLRKTVSHGVYQYMGAFARVAHDEILLEREDVKDADQVVSRHMIEERMAAVFAREVLRQSSRLDQIISRHNLDGELSEDDFVDREVAEMQDARIRDLRMKLAAKRTIAEAVFFGDDDEIKAAEAAVIEAHDALRAASPCPQQEDLFRLEKRTKRRKSARRAYFGKKASRGVARRSRAKVRAA